MDHSSTKPVTRLRGPLRLPHQPHRWLPLTRRPPPIDYPGSPRRPLSPPGQHYAQADAPQRPVLVQESSYLQLSSETAEFVTQCQICGKPCQLADEPLWTTLATTIPSTIGAMAVSSAPHLPSGSFEWLTAGRVDPGSRVVVLCPTVAHCRAVASHGADVLAVHRDPDTAEKLNRIPGVMAVCGSPESLPLNSSSFDAVLVHQGFHELAPGLALPEIARVLRPGSVLGVSWLVRDDTVPWVKRLAALLRTVDENAMSGDYGTESVHELISSKYFPEDEHTTKRLWCRSTVTLSSPWLRPDRPSGPSTPTPAPTCSRRLPHSPTILPGLAGYVCPINLNAGGLGSTTMSSPPLFDPMTTA